MRDTFKGTTSAILAVDGLEPNVCSTLIPAWPVGVRFERDPLNSAPLWLVSTIVAQPLVRSRRPSYLTEFNGNLIEAFAGGVFPGSLPQTASGVS